MKHEATRNKPRRCQPGEDSDNIKLDREFQSLIPPLSARELTDLHRSLDDAQGCRDALIIWKGHDTLVDGHNRISYCRERNYAFPVIEMEFSDRDAVKAHILSTQLGRRNLAPVAESYLRGKRYLETKKQGARRDKTSGHTDQKTTAERLGEEFKVSEKTIRRDARLAQAVDQVVENSGPDSRNLLLCREVGLTQADVLRVAKLKPAEQRQYLDDLREHGKRPRKPHKATREQKRHRPETEDEKITREWQTRIQVLEQSRPLEPSALPPDMSQEWKDEMRETIEEVIGRWQQVLQRLAAGKGRTSAARPRRRARTTSSSFKKSRTHGDLGEMLDPWER